MQPYPFQPGDSGKLSEQFGKRRLRERHAAIGCAVGDVEVAIVDLASGREDHIAHVTV